MWFSALESAYHLGSKVVYGLGIITVVDDWDWLLVDDSPAQKDGSTPKLCVLFSHILGIEENCCYVSSSYVFLLYWKYDCQSFELIESVFPCFLWNCLWCDYDKMRRKHRKILECVQFSHFNYFGCVAKLIDAMSSSLVFFLSLLLVLASYARSRDSTSSIKYNYGLEFTYMTKMSYSLGNPWNMASTW